VFFSSPQELRVPVTIRAQRAIIHINEGFIFLFIREKLVNYSKLTGISIWSSFSVFEEGLSTRKRIYPDFAPQSISFSNTSSMKK